MKVALLGYGRMGKEIETISIERHHEIVLKIDIDNPQDFTPQNLSNADVAIDFSIPSSAYENILKCFEANVPVVCGTTGWLDKYDEVVNICNQKEGTFFYASNYSLGVNLFFKLNKQLAQMMNRFSDYDVKIEEVHHIHKLDAPSGTAITLAEGIIGEIERKVTWKLDATDEEDIIGITAKRESEVPGIHKIKYDSTVDTIEIIHSSKSRKGLALGAVLAAEFISDKKGVFSMNDLTKAE